MAYPPHARCAAALVFALAAPVAAQERDPGVEWLTDIAAGERAARRTGKPMLLVFR